MPLDAQIQPSPPIKDLPVLDKEIVAATAVLISTTGRVLGIQAEVDSETGDYTLNVSFRNTVTDGFTNYSSESGVKTVTNDLLADEDRAAIKQLLATALANL